MHPFLVNLLEAANKLFDMEFIPGEKIPRYTTKLDKSVNKNELSNLIFPNGIDFFRINGSPIWGNDFVTIMRVK